MSDNDTDINEIAFVHLNKDVIVPADRLKYEDAQSGIPKLAFGGCGILWLFFLWKAGSNVSITFHIVVFLALVVIAIFFSWKPVGNWYEIDRKDGAINRWPNKKKKRKLSSILKENLLVSVVESGTGGYHGKLNWALRAQGTDRRGKMICILLFILPRKTSKEEAEALAKVIEEFLLKFLDGKTDTTDREKYRFSLVKGRVI